MKNVFSKIVSVLLISCLFAICGTGCNQKAEGVPASSAEPLREAAASETEEAVQVQLVLPDSIRLEKSGATYQLFPTVEPELPCSFAFSCSVADALITVDEQGMISYDSELSGTVEVYVKGTLEDGRTLNGTVPVLCGNLVAEKSGS